MKSLKICTVGVIAVVAGVGLAALISTVAQGTTTGQSATAAEPEAALDRSPAAVEVEAAIARTNLTGKLTTALGDDFGGVWFEPEAAQVHVGVTSPESRQAAEAIAAQAGLADAVRETFVRSTWGELEAAQERWSERLADLFARGEVSTSLAPDTNSLEVELGSEVSSGRRADLEREAIADSVRVSIDELSYPRSRATSESRCAGFAAQDAFCDPPIVAGVRIWAKTGPEAEVEETEEEEWEGGEVEEGVEVVGKNEECTAGPVVIKRSPVSAEDATKTYLLTAGHCVRTTDGLYRKWWTYNKEGTKGEPKEIGKAVNYSTEVADVGLIEINPTYWADGKDPNPVSPTIAPWDHLEPEPFEVIGQNFPMKNATTCISGSVASTECGTIIKVAKETTTKTKKKLKELVEVQGVTTTVGDSGSPWFMHGPYTEEVPTGFIEGIHQGHVTATNNPLFQDFDSALERLKAVGFKHDLKLLTEANKVRHPEFTGAAYPLTLSAEDSSESKFTAFTATIACKKRSFDGEFTEPGTEEVADSIELTPSYSECTEDKGRAVKVSINECKYKITLSEKVEDDHYKGELGLVCPEGKPGIEFDFYASHEDVTNETNPCEMTMPPQTGLQSVTLTNSEEKIVVDNGTIEGIKFKMQTDDCYCPGGDGAEATNGIYHLGGALTIAGEKEAEEVAIDMAGR